MKIKKKNFRYQHSNIKYSCGFYTLYEECYGQNVTKCLEASCSCDTNDCNNPVDISHNWTCAADSDQEEEAGTSGKIMKPILIKSDYIIQL